MDKHLKPAFAKPPFRLSRQSQTRIHFSVPPIRRRRHTKTRSHAGTLSRKAEAPSGSGLILWTKIKGRQTGGGFNGEVCRSGLVLAFLSFLGPVKKLGFPGFQETYRTFWPPPLHVENPHPTGYLPVCGLFLAWIIPKFFRDFPDFYSGIFPIGPFFPFLAY